MRRCISIRRGPVLLFLGLFGIACPSICEVLSIEEIRASQTKYHPALGADVQLTVHDEFYLQDGSCELLLTSHVGEGHAVYPGYLLQVWRAADVGFELLNERFGVGEVVVESLAAEGRDLLFVQDVAAVAGANIVATVIYYAGADCELRTVDFEPAEACGVELPRLTLETAFRGSVYELEDEVVRFSTALWCPNDPPNFPRRGQVEGSLVLEANEHGELVAKVGECRREERLCE